jgi:hypothetical protein
MRRKRVQSRRDLLRKIRELEQRIQELEAKPPQYIPVPYPAQPQSAPSDQLPWPVGPYPFQPFQPYQPTWTVTNW